jgi:hypothetical protein
VSARRPRGAARCRLRYPAATGLTDPLERSLQLCAGQPSRLRRCQGRLEELVSLGPAEAVLPGFDDRESGRVVLAQQRSELVGDLPAGPGCVLLSARQDGVGAGQAGVRSGSPAGLSSSPGRRPDRLRQATADPALRLLLRGDRGHDLSATTVRSRRDKWIRLACSPG